MGLGILRHCASSTLGRWDRIGRFRGDERTALRAYIITAMAGAEAEAALLGSAMAGDEHDREAIGFVLEALAGDIHADCGRQEARLRQATRQVVRRHIGKIERLARALAAYGTFDEEDAIRGVAGLPPAPVEVDWWAMQFAEIVEGARIAAPMRGDS